MVSTGKLLEDNFVLFDNLQRLHTAFPVVEVIRTIRGLDTTIPLDSKVLSYTSFADEDKGEPITTFVDVDCDGDIRCYTLERYGAVSKAFNDEARLRKGCTMTSHTRSIALICTHTKLPLLATLDKGGELKIWQLLDQRVGAHTLSSQSRPLTPYQYCSKHAELLNCYSTITLDDYNLYLHWIRNSPELLIVGDATITILHPYTSISVSKPVDFQLGPILLITTCDISWDDETSFVFVVVQENQVHVWQANLVNHQVIDLGLKDGEKLVKASVPSPCMATTENTTTSEDRDFLFAAVCSDNTVRYWDLQADANSHTLLTTITKTQHGPEMQNLHVTQIKLSAHGRTGLALGYDPASPDSAPASPGVNAMTPYNIERLDIWDHRKVSEMTPNGEMIDGNADDQIIDFQWGCSNSGQDLLLLSRTSSLVILACLRSEHLGQQDTWQSVWKIDPLT